MKLFVSALEYSANIHLRYLLCELIKRENIELCGIFDEKIISEIERESSVEIARLTSHFAKNDKSFKIYGKSLCNIENVAVMGFVDVLKRARFFLNLRKKCLNLALECDKILLMDSSSFNIPLAKKIKARDLQKEIAYYILPQVWAWKPWRAKVIEANCDKLCAILPFEVECYAKKARFVGHPLLDEIKEFRVSNSQESTHPLPPYAREGESKLDSCESTQNSPTSWCKKSDSKDAVVPSADFLLEADKRGSPPKSEKAVAFWRVRGAGRVVQPFLREDLSESKGQNGENLADSPLQHCDSHNVDSRNLDSSLHTSCFAKNDGVSVAKSHNDKISDNIITFMPGSRITEINRIFPIFLQVKDALKAQDSSTTFRLVVPRKFESKDLAKIYGDLSDFEISFDAHTSLFKSKFAFICSGTATLECALIGTPFVLGYLGRWIEAFVVKRFLNIRFVGLANILYSHIKDGENFHDEFLQENLTAQNLLNAYHSANPSDFLVKSLSLRKYLKNGSAGIVADLLLQE